MPAPDNILRLIEKFQQNYSLYKNAAYNESQTRSEFIDPFFKALGWDIDNSKGATPDLAEVIRENSFKIGGLKHTPDYGFRAGNNIKFFVEAKKPAVNIQEDSSPAFQLRRYGWSAQLPLSVLTDFEEFAVYDCRVEPNSQDKATHARINYIRFSDYEQRWDEIAEKFSREAVLDGALDKYVETLKGQKGITTVNAAFLKAIESWRELLARDLAARNPDLSQRDLNFAVQLTLDRIIFLRICEDRSIEPYGQLQTLETSSNLYEQLVRRFREADGRYNSGLFHFEKERQRADPDTLTLDLQIGDEALRQIIKNLYYPHSPYVFNLIPVEILGQVYEQFLGKVISLNPADRSVTVEEKPEVRKAGGVYYTPAYIVEYIVKNTVGKLLEGKTPDEAARLKILDPSCGSGSFLLGAYQYLLDWHRDYYVKDGPNKHLRAKRLYQSAVNEWRLTTAERKRILLNNIFGVDIDSQAVETTKLSLLMKVLEGETGAAIDTQLSMFRERALPDLDQNIKCGNSLIGPDFYEQQQLALFSDDEQYRINVFDWQTEFPAIMKAGGFDAVIGNPPYLRIQGLQENYGKQIDYFLKHYQSAVKRFDLYLLFIEQGFKLLTSNGLLGFICPHKFLNSDFGSGLRDFLIKTSALKSFVSFGNNLVFNQVSTYTGILFLERNNNSRFTYYEFADLGKVDLASELETIKEAEFAIYDLKSFSKEPWVLTHNKVALVLKKLAQQSKTLADVFDEILVGVQSGIDNIHVLKSVGQSSDGIIKLFSERANTFVEIETELVKPFLRGEDVHRFKEPLPTFFCIYPYHLVDGKTKILQETELKERFPLGYSYLNQYQEELRDIRIRQKTNPKYWYSCHRSRDMNVFETYRIITPEISLGCNMTLATAGMYHNTKVYSLIPSSRCHEHINYWLGVLNSKILWWFLSNTGYVLRGGYFVFKTNYLNPFPIRTINFSDPKDKGRHDQMVTLVERMLDLHKRLAAARTPQDKTVLQRQIEATERQIDRRV